MGRWQELGKQKKNRQKEALHRFYQYPVLMVLMYAAALPIMKAVQELQAYEYGRFAGLFVFASAAVLLYFAMLALIVKKPVSRHGGAFITFTQLAVYMSWYTAVIIWAASHIALLNQYLWQVLLGGFILFILLLLFKDPVRSIRKKVHPGEVFNDWYS